MPERAKRAGNSTWRRGLVAALLAAIGLVLPTGAPAHAAVRYDFPAEAPGPPYYARIIPPAFEEWTAIAFYRDPTCIPSDFNLLRFLDAPRAFGCRLTVEGFEIWRTGPGQDLAPMHIESREAGLVPVWFVRPDVMEAAMADGVLTITELSALPTLVVGSATRFSEVLHPEQSARQPSIRISAFGTLVDGRSFRWHVVHIHDGDGETKSEEIAFG